LNGVLATAIAILLSLVSGALIILGGGMMSMLGYLETNRNSSQVIAERLVRN
jgi:CHASE3 domain sensor protein